MFFVIFMAAYLLKALGYILSYSIVAVIELVYIRHYLQSCKSFQRLGMAYLAECAVEPYLKLLGSWYGGE